MMLSGTPDLGQGFRDSKSGVEEGPHWEDIDKISRSRLAKGRRQLLERLRISSAFLCPLCSCG
jgi:hypothetical protein